MKSTSIRLFSNSLINKAILGPKSNNVNSVYRWESSRPDEEVVEKLEIESKRRWLAYMRLEEFELPKLQSWFILILIYIFTLI